VPFEFIQNSELTEFTDWRSAAKALDYDDQIKAVKIARLANRNEFQAQYRQSELDSLFAGRDKELGDYTEMPKREYTPPTDKNIQIAKGIGKIKRVVSHGGQQRNRRAPHVR